MRTKKTYDVNLYIAAILVGLFFIVVFCIGIMNQNKTQPYSVKQTHSSTNYTNEKKWYEGGTLHNKTMEDWKNADYSNKIATAADFIAIFKKDMPTLSEAKYLVREIDDAYLKEVNSMKIAEVAAAIWAIK